MKNLSILVVEDDLLLREELVDYISIFIDNIYQADNGRDALAIYKKYRPDIIFTDMNMPQLNGLDLIEKIREVDKDIEIIIISAYTDIEYLLRAVELHLVSYLLKPIETTKLKSALIKSINIINSKSTFNRSTIELSDGYYWSIIEKQLYYKTKKIKLSNYEQLFMECLIKYKDSTVSYEVIHSFIYEDREYSRDSITSLVKRLRQKSTKDIVISSYKEGYRI